MSSKSFFKKLLTSFESGDILSKLSETTDNKQNITTVVVRKKKLVFEN
ncbi:hypothetical protein DE171_002994 [Clostridium beijerinckii]|nr:hypothetical protein [Clostridium beijerinckii]NYC50604.1 hypothetical protein [Clostridium beijerinckii]